MPTIVWSNGLAVSLFSLRTGVPKLIHGRRVQFLPSFIGTPTPADALMSTDALLFSGGERFSNVWIAADVAYNSWRAAKSW